MGTYVCKEFIPHSEVSFIFVQTTANRTFTPWNLYAWPWERPFCFVNFIGVQCSHKVNTEREKNTRENNIYITDQQIYLVVFVVWILFVVDYLVARTFQWSDFSIERSQLYWSNVREKETDKINKYIKANFPKLDRTKVFAGCNGTELEKW